MSKKFKLYFDYPVNQDKNTYYTQGSSPLLLDKLIKFFEDYESKIDKISGCFYLFNNETLYNKLKILGEKGIKIKLFSIPLEGYSETPSKTVKDFYSKKITLSVNENSKKDFAEKIYTNIKTDNPINFQFFVCPHIFVRSPRVKKFSRGEMPYSLHIKSLYIELKDGRGISIITSSNFAVRDLRKIELLFFHELETKELYSQKIFYDNLEKISSNLIQYKWNNKYLKNYFNSTLPPNTEENIYIAPFYENNQKHVIDKITNLIETAKHYIYICGQHISDEQILKAFLRSKKDVEINVLSQTFIDPKDQNNSTFRKPANSYQFLNFSKKILGRKNTNYYVNENLHAKFIIIDNTCIITTCNFTETQFIYKTIDIKSFDNMPDKSYSGIFSEIGQFLFLDNEELAKELLKHIDRIKMDYKTIKI